MRPNTVKSLWHADQPAFGAWLSSCSTLVAEQMGAVGFDWLVVDGEHSPADTLTLVQMLQAVSLGNSVPMARVPWNDPVAVKRVLDGGAYGVVIPWVNDRAQAEQAVAACRYPPIGLRGYGPYRGVLYGGHDYLEHANEEISCIIQIETVEAIERIDDILSVPGIDATLIGPSDLALSLGIPVQPDNPHPDHVAACRAVLEASRKHAVVPGIFTSGPEEGARRAAEGWRFIAIGSDSQYMTQTAVHALRTARGGA